MSGIEPRLAPRLPGSAAAELDAIVQPIRPILPEFDDQRQQPVAGPVGRPRDGSNREFGHLNSNCLLEGHSVLQRGRLLAGPSSDLGEAWARGEIGVGDMILDLFQRPTQPYLPAQALPMEDHCTFRCVTQFSPFLAVQIRVEYESHFVEAL